MTCPFCEFFDRAASTCDAEMETGRDILDGTGVMFPYYWQRGVASVTGFDRFPEMTKIAENKFIGNPRH